VNIRFEMRKITLLEIVFSPLLFRKIYYCCFKPSLETFQ